MPLHPTLAAVRRNLPRVARAQGFNARVTSGYRSRAKQAALYNRWLRGLQPYPVAPPGTSDHEKGIALDVVSTDIGKLVPLLGSVGLSWYGPGDPVHFYFAGLKSQTAAVSAKMAKTVPKKTKSVASKILDVTSWLPGPVGWASMVLDFLI